MPMIGGTTPHIELILNLKRRGYHVILIDYLESPPAITVADEHIRESTLSGEKVLKIAQQRNADLVISACIDQANLTAAYVAEKLDLPAPYKYEVAVNVTNKLRMKKLMFENDIPTSKYIQVRSIKEVDSHGLQFPVIVKPVDSNGSKGVRRAEDQTQLKGFFHEAIKFSRLGEALIEEFIEGTEIGIDAYISNGKATIIFSKDRCKIPSAYSSLQQIYGSVWPSDYVLKKHGYVKSIAEKIADAFDLNNTSLLIQAIVREDGSINVIEFAPRVGGAENYKIIQLATGFDMVDATVNSFLGLAPTLELQVTTRYWFDNYLYATPGVLGSVRGLANLLEGRRIEYFSTYKRPGYTIGPDISSNNRLGVIAINSSSRQRLHEKVISCIPAIDIIDNHGVFIMRRDIYEGEHLARSMRLKNMEH